MSTNRKILADFGLNQLEKITLKSTEITVEVLNLGAAIYSVKARDSEGKLDDLVLAYPEWLDYISNKDYFGCVAGRYANRIAGASFTLNGSSFTLSANEGENCLHGGFEGLHKRFYEVSALTDSSLSLSCLSQDGEDGFPGNLQVEISYTVRGDTLEIKYKVESDKDTIVNLTNHSYFNLAGHGNGSILDHEIQIFSDKYLPVDKNLIPMDIEPVTNSPVDFKVKTEMAYALRAPHEQITRCGGVDHNFILSEPGLEHCAAKVTHMYSGRTLEVFTTEPGLQFYTANHIDDMNGKDGAYYGKYPAFCLETQKFPNSPNRPDFPSCILRAGDVYSSQTNYKFGIEK